MRHGNLSKNHLQTILEIENTQAPPSPLYSPYDESKLSYIFDNPENCGAVGMFDGSRLVGWGGYSRGWNPHNSEKGVYEISSVIINKTHRGKGLGKEVLEEIITQIKNKPECEKIIITVSPKNIGALIMYMKRGFVIYDFKKNLYEEGVDKLLLSLED